MSERRKALEYVAHCPDCNTLWIGVESPGFVCVHDKLETIGWTEGPSVMVSASRPKRNRTTIECQLVTVRDFSGRRKEEGDR